MVVRLRKDTLDNKVSMRGVRFLTILKARTLYHKQVALIQGKTVTLRKVGKPMTSTAILNRLPRLRSSMMLAAGMLASLAITFACFTGTASATTTCDTDGQRLCLWDAANRGGSRIQWNNIIYGACYNIHTYYNDRVSSWDINIYTTVTFYDDIFCDGSYLGVNGPNEGSFPSWYYMNNRTSSFYVHPL